MPRWIRVIRGMIGTGLTFAAGVGIVGSTIGLVARIVGEISSRELVQVVSKTTVVAFIVGVAFSGVLATVAHGRTFERLSLRFVTGLGAAAGFLYFFIIAAASGARVWTAATAILNFTVLVLLGAGSAAGTLLVAKRAKRALKSNDELPSIGEAPLATSLAQKADVTKGDESPMLDHNNKVPL